METQGRRARRLERRPRRVREPAADGRLPFIALAALVLAHQPAIMGRLRGRDGGPGAFGAAEE
jgi:hypothetical protein